MFGTHNIKRIFLDSLGYLLKDEGYAAQYFKSKSEHISECRHYDSPNSSLFLEIWFSGHFSLSKETH